MGPTIRAVRYFALGVPVHSWDEQIHFRCLFDGAASRAVFGLFDVRCLGVHGTSGVVFCAGAFIAKRSLGKVLLHRLHTTCGGCIVGEFCVEDAPPSSDFQLGNRQPNGDCVVGDTPLVSAIETQLAGTATWDNHSLRSYRFRLLVDLVSVLSVLAGLVGANLLDSAVIQ